MNQKNFTTLTWSVFAGSTLLVLLAWLGSFSWEIESISIYKLFPVLGLLAWTTMWGHYITGAIRVKKTDLKKPLYYSGITSAFVLATMLLHPMLLAIAQYNNGEGTPPNSFINWVGEDLRLAVFLGTFSLLLFLSYEVFERIKNKAAVQRKWWLVSISQSLAMILIYVHALRLGGIVAEGWFMAIWLVMGVALIPCLYIIHTADFTKKSELYILLKSKRRSDIRASFL